MRLVSPAFTQSRLFCSPRHCKNKYCSSEICCQSCVGNQSTCMYVTPQQYHRRMLKWLALQDEYNFFPLPLRVAFKQRLASHSQILISMQDQNWDGEWRVMYATSVEGIFRFVSSVAFDCLSLVESTSWHVVGDNQCKVVPGCNLLQKGRSLKHQAVALEGRPPSQDWGDRASNGVHKNQPYPSLTVPTSHVLLQCQDIPIVSWKLLLYEYAISTK